MKYDANNKFKPELIENSTDEKSKKVSCLLKFKTFLGSSIKDRVQKSVISMRYDSEEKAFYYIEKPYYTDEDIKKLSGDKWMEPDENNLVMIFKMKYKKLQYLDENTSLFTETNIIDFGGTRKMFDTNSISNQKKMMK
jgi:hypothetical protein